MSKDSDAIGSFFALFGQESECRIVETILCHLMSKTELMKIEGTKTPVGAYEYDGIKLLKANVDAYAGGVDEVINLLNGKNIGIDWISVRMDFKTNRRK